MKTIIALLAFSVLLFSCNSTTNSKDQPAKKSEVAALKSIELHVTGMTCEGCENSVEKALSGVEGVVAAEASHLKELTTISYDTTKVKPEVLAETINNLGYKVVE